MFETRCSNAYISNVLNKVALNTRVSTPATNYQLSLDICCLQLDDKSYDKNNKFIINFPV